MDPMVMCSRMWQKNHLRDPSSFNILKEEQAIALCVLDTAIGEANGGTDDSMRLLLTLSKFGQKSTEPLRVDSMVDSVARPCLRPHHHNADTDRPPDPRHVVEGWA